MKKLIFLFLIIVSFSSNAQSNDDFYYFKRAEEKCDKQDYYGAIADYTKAIELSPRKAHFYSQRGVSKYYLKDYNGAVDDYTRAIAIDPRDGDYYFNRGFSKKILKDYYGAIADFTKAIELTPVSRKIGGGASMNGLIYAQIGISKELLNASDKTVHIKLFGNKNSLNVSVCQGVILNQMTRLLNGCNKA